VTPTWRKSSHSGSTSSDLDCVEVASLTAGVVGIRDSKDPGGPHLSVSVDMFDRLIRQLKDQ
jgi:Domain of unknown function (DUF397)